ncbi:hypothetical protein [Helicobacter macacae]|uniref:Uncharacterized protein n=1 Tax=Helicobacter macacae MIT 99-5501 TaxID=1357400 RepID=V8C6Q9_9HELI|nr:hypothetical protein [Helicobacter macacae]ETD23039.1 hypothetical protein HMPREF2086_01486 [Helicobacter macacae MIT 99-5501]
MSKDKKLWAMDAQEFAEYAKTASKTELAEYKNELPQYIEYLQAELRKYEAEQKALKGASTRLGLHLIEQLLRKAKGEIPAQDNADKNAQWRKNTDIIADNTSVEKFYEILDGLSDDEMSEVLEDNCYEELEVECLIEDAQDDLRRFREHEMILEELGI